MQVELHGYRAKSVAGNRATPIFTDENHPTWHIQPGNIRSARLHLDGHTFTGTVAVHFENRDGFAVARAAPSKRLGEFRAELDIDGHTRWQGRLHWFPNRYEQPRLRPVVALWADDKALARRQLQSLSGEGPDWMRFQTYRVWGALEAKTSATRAAGVWTDGFEAMLAQGSVESALALAGSAAFMILETGELEATSALVARMEPLTAAHGNAFNRADLLFLRSRLAVDEEDAPLALELARESASISWQSGDDEMWAIAMANVGDQLLALGRFAEALDTCHKVAPSMQQPRNRLIAELNVLWTELWGQEAGVWSLESARGPTREALQGASSQTSEP